MGVQVYSFPQKSNVKIPVRPGKRLQLIVAGHLRRSQVYHKLSRVTLSLRKFRTV